MPEVEAIRAFLQHYGAAVGLEYSVVSVPDEVNRTTPDIDALAEAEGGPRLAIEHTLVQTLRGQKTDNIRFMEVIVPLSLRLAPLLPHDMHLILPHGALQTGMNWSDIVAALERWVLAGADSFPQGFSSHPDIEGVPFGVDVLKPYDPIGLPFEITRMGPDKETRQNEVKGLLVEALERKHDKLSVYAGEDTEVVLLLESEDWVLIGPTDLYAAYREARGMSETPDIDQVWLARFYSSTESYDVFCFDAPTEVMEAAGHRRSAG